MTPRELLQRRLRRIAEDLRFRYYVVCPGCFSPIIVLRSEIDSPPSHIACEDCGKLVPFDCEAVCEYNAPD